jgi:hypothetical protein
MSKSFLVAFLVLTFAIPAAALEIGGIALSRDLTKRSNQRLEKSCLVTIILPQIFEVPGV